MTDGLLLVSFGGPEGPDDVIPFLENATRGRGIPRERLAEVGQHYTHFGGVSPINAQNRELLAHLHAAIRERLNMLIHVPFQFEFNGSQIIFFDHEPEPIVQRIRVPVVHPNA